MGQGFAHERLPEKGTVLLLDTYDLTEILKECQSYASVEMCIRDRVYSTAASAGHRKKPIFRLIRLPCSGVTDTRQSVTASGRSAWLSLIHI